MKLTLTLFIILQCIAGIAQDTFAHKIDWNPYLIGISGNRKIGDDQNLVRKILNQQFSAIVTGQANTSIGNFASLTPTDAKIEFAGNLISERGSVLAIKASGKATDGLLALFENSKLNTQVSLEVKYHVLSLNNLTLSYDRDSGLLHNQKINKIKYDFDLERLSIIHKRTITDLEKKGEVVKKESDSLRTLLRTETKNEIIASLNYEIEKRDILLDSISKALKSPTSMLGQLRNLKNKTIGQLETLSFSSAVEGFTIKWWSFGYKANHNKFKLFYPTSAFAQQVLDTTFVSHEASVQWSYYRWNTQGFKTIFAAIGANFGYGDNFSTLDKREISETNNYGPNPGLRSATKKYDVYEGAYEKDLVNLKLYGEIYYFLFNNNVAALHINPEWVIKKHDKPVTNCFAGLLLTFKKKGEETSIVNAELYYQFLDLFKTTETEYKLFERNSIGLRFSFPIQFKYK